MNEHHMMLTLGWATLAVLLVVLVLEILHRRRLNQISDQLAEGATDNGETLKDVVERENDATRKHVSHAVDAVANNTKLAKQRIYDLTDRQDANAVRAEHNANETRGQLTGIKERVQHLIKVADDWLRNRKPPAPP